MRIIIGLKRKKTLIHDFKTGIGGREADKRSAIARMILVVITILIMLHVLGFDSSAASSAPVTIEAIQATPSTVPPGQHPDIAAGIRSVGNKRMEVTVIAAVTRPDHVVKSWQWKKIIIAPGEKKSIILPKEYDTKLAGAYKVEFVIYSADMSRRLYALSRTFTIAEPADEHAGLPERELKPVQAQERTYLGIGAYGNTLNPAGGATVLLWPFRNVGLQGIYTVGKFTSYEGRLLVKIESSSGFNPYLGAGFLHVSKKADIIGVDTTFEDSKVSGVAGVELPLGRSIRGYVEVSGSGIKLEKDVTNGALTGHATVKYIPVTICLGLVWSVF